jgi:hypothetical protein
MQTDTQASENRNKGDGVDEIDGNGPELVDSAIGETLCELLDLP